MIRIQHHEWWRRHPEPARSRHSGAIAQTQRGTAGSATAFWSMVGFTAILLLAPQTYFPALIPFRIALCAAAISLLAYASHRMSHHQPILIMSREIRVALGLAGWAVLTIPLSLWPGGSLNTFLDQYSKALIIFCLLSGLLTSLVRFRQLLWTLAVLSVPLAATGIENYLTGLFMTGGAETVKRIQGYEAALTSNPNDLALMLNLILPLSIALFLVERGVVRRVLLAAAIGVSVIAVITTFSRGGFVTLVSIALMYLWKFRRSPARGWLYAAVVLGLACVPLLPGGYLDRISTITDSSKDQTGSSEARWRDAVAAVAFVAKHPVVGAGMASDQLALNDERGSYWSAVHNVYLQYAVDLGLPGLALFLLLLTGCIRRLGAVRRDRRHGRASAELGYLADGVQISLYAFAVAGLFHPVAYNFYFYYIAGLAVALNAMSGARRATDRSTPAMPQRMGV